MRDQYGRNIEYLRISVTDRCNLRCIYCMPEEGVEQISHADILRYDEIALLCRLFAAKGITRVKLTGGEPLVRRGIWELVQKIKEIDGIDQVTMTTNGVLLAEQLERLTAAGLDAVNISLDTMDAASFERVTRRKMLSPALEGLTAALSYPGLKVKLNCVPLKGVNEDQWIGLAKTAKENPVDVRFIEMMPIGLGKKYRGCSQEEVLRILTENFGEPHSIEGRFGNGPAVYVEFPDFRGKIGFISAMSHKFCESCNRIRLTADGFLKPCLQYAGGIDLKTPLRAGMSAGELEHLIEAGLYHKPSGHHFEEKENDDFEKKKMFSIGG